MKRQIDIAWRLYGKLIINKKNKEIKPCDNPIMLAKKKQRKITKNTILAFIIYSKYVVCQFGIMHKVRYKIYY